MYVNQEKCIGCGLCVADCRWRAIKLVDDKALLNEERCSKCGHCIAICPVDALEGYDTKDTKPYDQATFDIDADRLLNAIKFRRSIRSFKSKKVDQADIDMLIDAGRFTPTGGNRQDVSYILVQDSIPALRKAIIYSLKELADTADQAKNVYVRGYAKMWERIYNEYVADPEGPDEVFFGAPLIIFVLAKEPVNAVLAANSIELMANSLGLGACYIGAAQYVADFKLMADFLNIQEKRRKVAACIAIGHPNVKYYRTVPRKPAEIEVK